MAGSASAHDWELATLLAGYLVVPDAENRPVVGLTLDSRCVAQGDLFIAAAGHRRHGLEFAADAVALGATAVLYEPVDGCVVPDLSVPMFALERLGEQIGKIADRFYFQPSAGFALVGVTGTNGKTSVSSFIAQALESFGTRTGLIGTLGSGFVGALSDTGMTTPDAVCLQNTFSMMRDGGAHAVAMEVSSHALAQSRIAGSHFDVAVFTNLSRDHLDYHGTMQEYANAKRRLLQQPGLTHAVVNADDAAGAQWIRAASPELNLIAFAIESDDEKALAAKHVVLGGQGLSFELHWKGEMARIESALLGRFNVYNLLAAAGALVALGYPLSVAAKGLSGVKSVAGRMQALGGARLPRVVIDYAHTPDALEKTLCALREHCEGTLYCVFGCGGDRDIGKRGEMAAVAERFADAVIVTDDNPRSESPAAIANDILAGFVAPASVRVIHDRASAIETAISEAAPGDCVLIAGKGHERYQQIGLERRFFSDEVEVSRVLEGRL